MAVVIVVVVVGDGRCCCCVVIRGGKKALVKNGIFLGAWGKERNADFTERMQEERKGKGELEVSLCIVVHFGRDWRVVCVCVCVCVVCEVENRT